MLLESRRLSVLNCKELNLHWVLKMIGFQSIGNSERQVSNCPGFRILLDTKRFRGQNSWVFRNAQSSKLYWVQNSNRLGKFEISKLPRVLNCYEFRIIKVCEGQLKMVFEQRCVQESTWLLRFIMPNSIRFELRCTSIQLNATQECQNNPGENTFAECFLGIY